MKKTFHFGKIAYANPKRKTNAVDIEVELRELDNGEKEFSASGAVWNNIHTDWYTGGQCLDSLVPYFRHNKLFKEIYDLWNRLHLNGLNAGTHKQAAIVDKYFKEKGERYDYDVACKVLKKHHLYVDKLADGEVLNYVDKKNNITPEHYPYGHGWVVWRISDEDMKRIEKLFETENA